MKKWMIAACFVILLAMVSGVSGVPGAAAQADPCQQKGGTWDAAQQKCTQAATVQIQIDYPLTLSQNPVAGPVIDQFLQKQRQDFFTPLADPMFYYSPGPLTLTITYEEIPFSADITTLKFTIDTYLGGPHPNMLYQTFTFDLKGQRVLTLNDLFLPGSNPLTVIDPIVEQSLKTQLGDYADATMIQQGTGTDPANYQNFTITPDGLTFFFPPYQVAPYVAGPQTVTIPLASLSTILAAPFNGQP